MHGRSSWLEIHDPETLAFRCWLYVAYFVLRNKDDKFALRKTMDQLREKVLFWWYLAQIRDNSSLHLVNSWTRYIPIRHSLELLSNACSLRFCLDSDTFQWASSLLILWQKNDHIYLRTDRLIFTNISMLFLFIIYFEWAFAFPQSTTTNPDSEKSKWTWKVSILMSPSRGSASMRDNWGNT